MCTKEVFWRLRIICDDWVEIFGAEEILRAAIQEWRDAEESKQNQLLHVIGFCNSMDKAEAEITVKTEYIKYMTLTRMY